VLTGNQTANRLYTHKHSAKHLERRNTATDTYKNVQEYTQI